MNSQGATPFEPSIEWVNEDDCDTLLLYLPGFTKEQLRVQLKSRTLIISGQRKLHENTWIVFRKEFPVPEHCDVNKIRAKFESSILYVKQPKSTTLVAKQEEKPRMNAPTPTSDNHMDDQQEMHQDKAKEKPDSEPTSLTQQNGKYDVSKDPKDGPAKDSKDVSEYASKKMDGGSSLVMKLKPLRKDVIKVLVVVVGIVVGVYCTNLIQSWIGYT